MEFIRKHYLLILFCIPVISFALHFHVFNLDLVGNHVWRQTETQTVINNFYTEDLNILHPRVNDHADTDRLHRMEFPFIQWLFAMFYKLLGPHIMISRVLSFLIGLGSVGGMFYLCECIFKNKAIAIICAWCFNFSPLFYFYTLNPMPDNMALCCGIWSIGLFCKYMDTAQMRHAVWSATFLCLAVLAKLPFILYGAFMFAWLLVQLRQKERTMKELVACIGIFSLFMIPALAWYVNVIPGWGNNPVLKGLLDTQMGFAELSDIFLKSIYSTLPELIINYGSVLFFAADWWYLFKNGKHHHRYFPSYALWGVSIGLYFIFEMSAITTVHDYYLFPFMPQIFLLVAYGAYWLLAGKHAFLRKLAMVCLVILPLTAFLRADTRWDTKTPEFNQVYYKYKEELRGITPKDALCIVGNDDSHYILLYYIDRKGWAFDNNKLNENLLVYYINHGAQYLFIDNHMDEDAGIKSHLGEKIFDKETVRVYKIK